MRLAGIWYNQLGSKMELVLKQGNLSGWYETAVGSASGPYVLAGRTDTDDDAARNVGWVVSWENDKGSSDSVTAWSGELQEIDGEEVISTTWLLTIETTPATNWKSTLVGKDIFTRTPPDEGSSKRAFLMGMCSNPL
ncbi:MAG: avidin/streptavidin family protein [Pyrinomonadaceae bacterium]